MHMSNDIGFFISVKKTLLIFTFLKRWDLMLKQAT